MNRTQTAGFHASVRTPGNFKLFEFTGKPASTPIASRGARDYIGARGNHRHAAGPPTISCLGSDRRPAVCAALRLGCERPPGLRTDRVGRPRALPSGEFSETGRRVRRHCGSLRAQPAVGPEDDAGRQALRRLSRSAGAIRSGRGRRGDARSSTRALSLRGARRQEGCVSGKTDVALHRGEPADDSGGAQDRPHRADRHAAPQRSGGDRSQAGLRQRNPGQGDDGQAHVELERLQSAGQFARCPASWTGSASSARRRIAIWSPCASAPGATSGTTPAAT